MSQHQLFTLEYGLAAAAAAQAVGLSDPTSELPALSTFADAAQLLHAAQTEHQGAMQAWQRFAATNPHDDPAHNDHQIRAQASRQTLIGAQHEFDIALIALETARGNSSPVTGGATTKEARIARALQTPGVSRAKPAAPTPRYSNITDDKGHVVAVQDHRTGLMWATTCQKADNWQHAKSLAADLTALGHSDWRLPECDELLTIVDRSVCKPAADHAFFSFLDLSDWYWTNTPAAWSPASFAWLVSLSYGVAYYSPQGYEGLVLAVRGPVASAGQ